MRRKATLSGCDEGILGPPFSPVLALGPGNSSHPVNGTTVHNLNGPIMLSSGRCVDVMHYPILHGSLSSQ